MQNSSASEAWLQQEDRKLPLRGNCSFGRSLENQVVIASERASRRHAIIHAQGHEYFLVDLGSKNKTFLNQRHVTHPTLLRDGDAITIAGESFTFHQTTSELTDDEEAQLSQMTVMDLRVEQCWVLIGDLVNFTMLSQRETPDKLADLVGRWVRTCKELVEKNGGAINKFLGDGFMAFWRGGEASAPQVQQALHSLREAQAQFEMEFRVVLHYGRLSIGGAAALGEESLMGADLNFAFRIEKVAGQLQENLFLSEAAANILQPSLAVEAIPGEHEVRDFPGVHRFYRLG